MTDKRVRYTSIYLGAKCEFRKTDGWDEYEGYTSSTRGCHMSATHCYLDPFGKLEYRCDDHVIDCIHLDYIELSENEIICSEILGS